MTDLIALLLLLVCLTGVMFFIVGAPRPGGAGRGLAGRPAPGGMGGIVSGLVAAVAGSGVAAALDLGLSASLLMGLLTGVLFAVLAVIGSADLRNVALGVYGAAGLATAVLALVTEASCSPVPAGLRVIAAVLLGGLAAAGIIVRALSGRFRPQSILGVFGAVKVVTFLASPFGVSVLELPVAAWVVVIVAAAGFGLAAAAAPDLVIGLTALAVSFSTIVAAGTIGTPCGTSGNPDDLAVLLGFVAAYLVAGGAVRAVGRRKVGS